MKAWTIIQQMRHWIIIIVLCVLLVGVGVFSAIRLAGMTEQLRALESSYAKLQSDYNSLQPLQARYSSLESDYNSLQARYSSLESDLESDHNSLQSLQSRYSSLESNYNFVWSRYTRLLQAIDDAMRNYPKSVDALQYVLGY